MTNYQVALVPSRDGGDGPAADFDWTEYLDLCGLNPAKDPSLFAHVQFLSRTVFEVVCAPGKFLFIRTNNGIRPARIETSVGVQILVDFQDVTYIDKDWFGVNDLVQDPEEFKTLRRDFVGERQMLEFVNIADLLTFAEEMETPISQLVKPGQYFEIQDSLFPCTVMVAKVLENNGGIVTYECWTPDIIKVIHLASPFCHALGWAQSGAQRVEYYNKEHVELAKSQVGSRVPHILFEHFAPPVHLFQLEHLVEVLEPNEGQYVCPGHVSQIINEHYVAVTYFRPTDVVGKKIVVSRNTRGVYVPGSSVPKGMMFASPTALLNDKPFTWSEYKQRTKQYNGVPVLDCAVVPVFKKKITASHVIEFKTPSMQFVEILSYSKGYMTSGLVTRGCRDMFFVSLGYGEKGKLLPMCMGSLNIFPCGFAAEHDIPFFAEPPFFTLSEVSPSQNRFDKRSYRSIPGPVFRKFVYSGRGRPEKKWNFMTDNWLTGDKWLPPVSIRRTCRVGEWIDAKLYSQLADTYSAGPMPPTIEQIVKDFYRCTKLANRNDIFAVMDTDCDVPTIVVKHRWRAEHTKLRVPAPETARQFAGWARGFLRCIGCCPSLLSLDESISCIDGCEGKVPPPPDIQMVREDSVKRASPEGRGGPRKKAKKDEQGKQVLADRNASQQNSPSKALSRKAEKSVDYSKWPKEKLLNHLLTLPTDSSKSKSEVKRAKAIHNNLQRMYPKLMLQTSLSSENIVGFNDVPTVMNFGFEKPDARCLVAAVEQLRITPRVSPK